MAPLGICQAKNMEMATERMQFLSIVDMLLRRSTPSISVNRMTYSDATLRTFCAHSNILPFGHGLKTYMVWEPGWLHQLPPPPPPPPRGFKKGRLGMTLSRSQSLSPLVGVRQLMKRRRFNPDDIDQQLYRLSST